MIDLEDGLSDAELRGEVLTGADLFKLRASGSSLVDCELSGASMAQADLWRVELRGCRMSGVGARRCTPAATCASSAASSTPRRCGRCRAERVTFEDCVLREADLTGSTWKDAALVDCDLDAAIVVDADLRGTASPGSSIDRVIGADSLRGIVIAEDQALGLGLRVLDALGITVEDGSGDASGTMRR